MTGLRMVLAAAAVIVAGSLSASALPTNGARPAGFEGDQSSLITQTRSSRAARRCFNRCVRGKRHRTCQQQEDKQGCCSQRCGR